MKLKTTAIVPIYLTVMLLLLYGASMLTRGQVYEGNRYLLIFAIELAVYFVPSAIFTAIKGRGYIKKLSPLPPKLSCWQMVVSSLLLVTLCGALWSVISFRLGITAAGSYSVFPAEGAGVLPAALLIVFPALAEEYVFRGIILYEYGKFGKAVAVIFSSATFAIFHFSLGSFVYYFAAGTVLAIVTVITGSVFPAMIVHILHNLFTAYGQEPLANMLANFSDTPFVMMILVIAVLVALFYFLTVLDRHYAKLAKSGIQAPPPAKDRKGNEISFTKALAEAFLSPYFLLLLLIFVAISLDVI